MKTQTLQKIEKVIGKRALTRLRKGGILRVWRCSSPHNWYVEGARGAMLWHSSDWGDHPSLDAFEKLSESDRKISYSWIHSDGGRPESTDYILKKEYLYPSKK